MTTPHGLIFFIESDGLRALAVQKNNLTFDFRELSRTLEILGIITDSVKLDKVFSLILLFFLIYFPDGLFIFNQRESSFICFIFVTARIIDNEMNKHPV